MYMAFDKAPTEKLTKQKDACYHYGNIGESIPQHIMDERIKHVKFVGALEQTLLIFNDMPKSRSIIRLTKERLAQEKKWVAYYDECFRAHKEGRDKRNRASSGFDITFLASVIAAEERSRDVNAEREAKKIAEKRLAEARKERDKKRAMVAKSLEPDGPRHTRKFFMLRKKSKTDNKSEPKNEEEHNESEAA